LVVASIPPASTNENDDKNDGYAALTAIGYGNPSGSELVLMRMSAQSGSARARYAGCGSLGSTGPIPLVTKILQFLHAKESFTTLVRKFETGRTN
jgi:hypothetical protein